MIQNGEMLYPFGLIISLKMKPTIFESITCTVWNIIQQGIGTELYIIHNKISDFKGATEIFQ